MHLFLLIYYFLLLCHVLLWLFPHHNRVLLVRSEMLLANCRLLILPYRENSHLCILRKFFTGHSFEGIRSLQIANKILASINVFARRMCSVTNHTHHLFCFVLSSVVSFCSSVGDIIFITLFYSYSLHSFSSDSLSFLVSTPLKLPLILLITPVLYFHSSSLPLSIIWIFLYNGKGMHYNYSETDYS